MDVTSRELRAWLNPKSDGKEGESSLHHAFCDGDVEIIQTEPGRTRRGTSQHAEYYVAEEKLILNGGLAQMVDSVKGATRGRQLIYYSRSDSLQVEGAPAQPASSTILRN
jgi:lipopolysaccharide export system protein LptA